MIVNLEITFTPDEIKEMVLDRLKDIETHVEGAFEVHCQYGYLPPVTATFVPRHAEETPDSLRIPLEPLPVPSATPGDDEVIF